MAIAYLGNRGLHQGNASASGFFTVSPISEVLAGDLLLMNVAVLGGNAPVNINDSQGNVWRTNVSRLNSARVAICSCVLARELQTFDTITMQVGPNFAVKLNLEEFTGIAGTQIGAETASNSGSGTALSSGSTAPVIATEKLWVGAFAIDSAQASWTPDDTGFSIISAVGLALLSEYRITSGSGPQASTGTAGTTGTWAGAIAGFIAGGGPPEQRGLDLFLTR